MTLLLFLLLFQQILFGVAAVVDADVVDPIAVVAAAVVHFVAVVAATMATAKTLTIMTDGNGTATATTTYNNIQY